MPVGQTAEEQPSRHVAREEDHVEIEGCGERDTFRREQERYEDVERCARERIRNTAGCRMTEVDVGHELFETRSFCHSTPVRNALPAFYECDACDNGCHSRQEDEAGSPVDAEHASQCRRNSNDPDA